MNKLKKVSGEILKRANLGHPLWFNNIEADLYIEILENTIVHFEILYENQLIEGGINKPIKYGKINNEKDNAGSLKKSRVVEYIQEIPDLFLQDSILIIRNSEGLDPNISTLLIEFLNSKSDDSTLLQATGIFKDYVRVDSPKPKHKQNNKIFVWTLLTIIIFALSVFVIRGIPKIINSFNEAKRFKCVKICDFNTIIADDKCFKETICNRVFWSYEENICHTIATNIREDLSEIDCVK